MKFIVLGFDKPSISCQEFQIQILNLVRPETNKLRCKNYLCKD